MYTKMCITVLISLYTTRLVLSSLGSSDYGVYNLIGGVVVLFGFLNSTLANATQRFMSYAEGEGNLEKKRMVFNVSMLFHVGIAAITLFLLLVAMYPLFHNVLVIPDDRLIAAEFVYLSVVFSTTLTILNVPYDAIMNAHENMLYYSIIGVVETVLRLIVAFACLYTSYDKLIVYGALSASVPLFSLIIMKIYCHRNYRECRFDIINNWDPRFARKILSFSGWNFLTAISSLFTAQGIGIVLNMFFGTILNAAQGIAQQFYGYLSSFSINMMKAVSPVVTKYTGANNQDRAILVAISGCKFSTFLILLFAIPSMLEINYILEIWLTKVPDWAPTFCVMQIVTEIIVQMGASMATAVYANGDIKSYAIYKSITNLSPLLFVYLCFSFGCKPYWLYIPMILVWGIGGNSVIIMHAKKLYGVTVIRYLREVLTPILLVTFFMLVFGCLSHMLMKEGLVRLIMCSLLTTTAFFLSIFGFGLNNEEKNNLFNVVSLLKARIANT